MNSDAFGRHIEPQTILPVWYGYVRKKLDGLRSEPDERLGVTVAVVDVVPDGVFQLFGGSMDASPELLFGKVANHRSTRFSHEADVGVKCR